MSAAQLDILPHEPLPGADLSPAASASPTSLREQAAAQLAAHRQRRTTRQHTPAIPLAGPQKARRNPIAASVQQKYAQSPSYRAFLADEAQKAIEEAAAAAEVAARTHQAVAAAQQQLLQELELWTAPQAFTPETAVIAPAPVQQISTPAGLTVRLYEDLGRTAPLPARPESQPSPSQTFETELLDREASLLDQEIAFRQSPHFDDFRDPNGPIEPLAANLLEFPRQLIAARKVRPTFAEGPLREEPTTGRDSQLRIFEVEATAITHVPAPAATPAEWSSIWLDAATQTHPDSDTEVDFTPDLLPSLLPPQTAAVHLRFMAAAVDAILVLTAGVAFTAVAVRAAGTLALPTGIPAALTAAGTLALFYLLYNTLFFTLSDQTPGMRYARIGFCTFTDENPSRAAMRRRILATLVAVCPLALGLIWIALDDDRLGWHDRISRMYPRAY